MKIINHKHYKFFFESIYKNGWKIIKYGDIEIEKHRFHQHESLFG